MKALFVLLFVSAFSMSSQAQFWWEDQPGSGQIGNVSVRTYFPVSCETNPPNDKLDWIERTRKIRDDQSPQIEAVRFFNVNVTISVEQLLVVQAAVNLLRCDKASESGYRWSIFEPRSQDRLFVTGLDGLKAFDQFVPYSDDPLFGGTNVYLEFDKILKPAKLKKLNAGKEVTVQIAIYHAVPNGDESQFRDVDMIRVLFKGFSFYNPHIELEMTLKRNAEGKIEIIKKTASFLG